MQAWSTLPPWAGAMPGRHGCRDARGYRFTAAHEVNTAGPRRSYSTGETTIRDHEAVAYIEVEGFAHPTCQTRRRPNEDRIKVLLLGVTTPFEQRRVRQSPRDLESRRLPSTSVTVFRTGWVVFMVLLLRARYDRRAR